MAGMFLSHSFILCLAVKIFILKLNSCL